MLFNNPDRDRQLNFPCLKKLEIEVQTLQSANEGMERRQNEIEYAAQRDQMAARESFSIETIGELSRQRAKLKAEAESLQSQIAINSRRLEDVNSEHRQLRDHLDSLCSAREALFRQLSGARTNEDTTAMHAELLPVLKALAQFSGDRKALQEYERAELAHQTSLPYVVNDRCLYHTADKTEIVEENDPRARWTAYGKGVRISRDEARRLGLIPKEAQS
jgi:chromosome segregation ATPase